MEIQYFKSLPSTQKYLVERVRSGAVDSNLAIVAQQQSAGIGSRNNSWIAKKGDLLFSFCYKREQLPKDLPISSASIYFAYLMKELFCEMGAECWLKWPNDIYKKNKKAGGVVTQLTKGFYIVGIGINLAPREGNFANFDIKKEVSEIVKSYFLLLKKAPKWQEIFSKFRLEFERNKSYSATINGVKTPLTKATLCTDGALLIDNERIYSLR